MCRLDTHGCLLVLVLLFAILSPGPALGDDLTVPGDRADNPSPSRERSIENVFLIIIDGLRNSEAFKDPTHQYIPHIWNDLRPLGTMYNTFMSLGRTVTTGAHYSIATGISLWLPNRHMNQTAYNILQEEPSLFQYYRHQLGIPKNETWLLNGKGDMMGRMGECLNPFYRDNYSPHVAVGVGARDDQLFNMFNVCIDTYHPSLMVINLADVDNIGHLGDWKLYTDAILHADTIVYSMCQKIWQDPHYADNTAIIITSDHGRHLDYVSSGFNTHGCCCKGCREVPFLVIGPGIKQNVAFQRPGYLRDIAPTIAHMLGFSADFAKGRVLHEIFDPPPAPGAACVHNPSITFADGKLHAAIAVREVVGLSHIYYYNSQDNGQTWNNETCLSDPPQLPAKYMVENDCPAIISDGNRVSVVWSSTQAYGPMKIVVRESFDGGKTWQDPVLLACSNEIWGDYHPDACYVNGVLYVTWTDVRYYNSFIYMAEVQGSMVTGCDTLEVLSTIYSRSDADADIHLVFQEISDLTQHWDIAYSRYDGTAWRDHVYLTETAGHSLHPDIAVDSSGLHVVWAESENDRFKVMIKNSADGINWSNPIIVGESLLGAWLPRISAADGMLAVVWEGYEGMKPSIFYSTSNDDGLTWTTPVKVYQNDKIATHPALLLESMNSMHVMSTSGIWPTGLMYANIVP